MVWADFGRLSHFQRRERRLSSLHARFYRRGGLEAFLAFENVVDVYPITSVEDCLNLVCIPQDEPSITITFPPDDCGL